MKMTEKKIATPSIPSINDALEQLKTALEKAHNLQNATNSELQNVTGKLLGGVRAFSKDDRKVNAFLDKGFKLLKKDAVLKKYTPVIIDYVLNEAGVTQDEMGYVLSSSKKLDSAQQSLGTTSLLDYKSKAKVKEEEKKKEEKQLAKQQLVDASAKERVLLLLNSQLSNAKVRLDKEMNKPQGKRNGKEAQKIREERAYLEMLIVFLEEQK